MSVAVAAVRSGIAVAVSCVLVVTLVTPASAEAESVQTDPDLTMVLGAPASTPAEALTPQLPVGDFESEAAASQRKLVGVPPREYAAGLANIDLEELTVTARDEFTTTYELPGGAGLAALGETPLNAK